MPDITQAVLVLVLAVGVLAFGIVAISAAYEDTAPESVAVENETIEQNVGTWVAVDAVVADDVVAFDSTNVSVYNASGVQLDEGDDFEWNATDGTVGFFDTDRTTDGETATISYEYDRRPEQAQAMMGPIRNLTGILGFVPLVLVVGSIIIALHKLTKSVPSQHYGGRR